MLVAEAHWTQIRATACQVDEPGLHSSSVMSKPFRTPCMTGPCCLEGGMGGKAGTFRSREGERGRCRCLPEWRIMNKVFLLLPFMAGIERHPLSFPLPSPVFPPLLPPPQSTPLRGPCLSLLLGGGGALCEKCMFPRRWWRV